MTLTFDEILAKAALPERVVPLVLAGDHLERIAELERQAAVAPAPVSLADRNPVTVIAEEIGRLQEEMRASEVPFVLRAVGGPNWEQLKALQPVRTKDEEQRDFTARWFTWVCVMVSETCAEPKMTPAEVAALAVKLPGSSWDQLAENAWGVNAGKVLVPFSSLASVLTPSTDAMSKPVSESGSPSPSSAVKSAPARRRTSTKKAS